MESAIAMKNEFTAVLEQADEGGYFQDFGHDN